MTTVPGAREVREEDAFDVARVASWLRDNAATPEGLDGDPSVPPICRTTMLGM